MNRLFLLSFIFLLLSFGSSNGQAYPAYKVTAYDTASKGYYFFSVINGLPRQKHVDQTQMILDDKGNVIYYKAFKGLVPTGDFKLWPNGLMSYYKQNSYYLMDSNFTIVDSVSIKNGY